MGENYREADQTAELKLVSPKISMEQAYLDFIADWKASGEEVVPFSSRLVQGDYGGWLEDIQMIEKGPLGKQNRLVPEHVVVPSHFYFLVDAQGAIIGAADIRHYLNAYLISYGGQIGYGVRPSRRKEGYGTRLLAMALRKAGEFGLSRVLLTSYKSNTAATKIIIANGGCWDGEAVKGGETVQRFWVETGRASSPSSYLPGLGKSESVI